MRVVSLVAVWSVVAVCCPVEGFGQADSSRIPVDVTGIVRDEKTGKPIPGVEVSIQTVGEDAFTDAEGRYTIEDVRLRPDRDTPVDAVLPGYFPEERYTAIECPLIVVIPKDREPHCTVDLDFRMRRFGSSASASPRCTVTGRLLDVTGERGIDGLVFVLGTDEMTLSDPDGAYRLENVPAGLVELRGASAGWRRQQRLLWVSCAAPEEGPTLDFYLLSAPVT